MMSEEQLEELKKRQRLAKARVIANAHLAAEELAATKAQQDSDQLAKAEQVASVFLPKLQ